jgi:EmrB/QacA subfamily drug resistance transporter
MTAAPASDRARWFALYTLCAGVLMIVLDTTIVNVALPSIQHDLGFTDSSLAWVVNAYLIAFGGLLLLAGRIGDLVGRRRVFLTGLGLFTVASFCCGIAQDQLVLVTARFAQGVGGALTSAVILGMIVTLFPEPREQAKAIGVYAFVASGGGAIGLLAGGVLTQVLSWHWIFFVNVPIGVATAFVAVRLLDADEKAARDTRGGVDVLGAVLITAALMLGVYTIVKPATELGWTAGRTLLLGAVAVLLLAAFVIREATARNPLMPLRVFRSRELRVANLVQMLSVAGMFGVFFLGALYLQKVLHYDALRIGLSFLPVAVVMGGLSLRYTARLITRFGFVPPMVAGLTLIAASLALLTRTSTHGGYATVVLPAMVLMGAGAGLAFPALMTLAMSGAAPSDAGLASGLVNTTAQVGGALGLAVLAASSASRTARLSAAGHGQASALVGGFHLAFWIAVGLVLAAIALTLTLLHRPAGAAESPVATDEPAGASDEADVAGESGRAREFEPAGH